MKRKVAEYYFGSHKGSMRRIGQLSRTKTPCSCSMCGNPRKYFGELTMRERKWDAVTEHINED